jgi:hypothetical protein
VTIAYGAVFRVAPSPDRAQISETSMSAIHDAMSVAPAVITLAVFGLAYVDKLPWVRKRPAIASWVDEASAAACNLALILPTGSTKAQAEAAAVTKAAEIIGRVEGGPTTSQGQIVNLILGELGHILPPGHIVPETLAPVVSDVQKLILALQAQLVANQPPAAAVAPPPAPIPVAVV